MARNVTFKVSQDDNSPEHEVKVTLPDTFTKKQIDNLVEEGLKSVRIKVQGTLRRRLAKGVKPGVALNKEAQAAFDAVINGTRIEAPKVRVDAGLLKLTREQIDALVSQGAEVFNIPQGV